MGYLTVPENYKRIHYGTLSEFVEAIEALPLGEGNHRSDIPWQGGVTEAEAIDLAKYGWKDGAKRAAEMADKIANRLAIRTGLGQIETIGYDVTGVTYDPGSYMSGVPECWGTLKVESQKRAIYIGVNICASGGVSADVLFKRGTAIAALTMMLQNAGYPVTIDICEGPVSIKLDHVVRVLDASSGSQVDVDRVVFAIAHPAMLRCLYRAIVSGERDSRKLTWDLGSVYSDAKPSEDCDLFLGGTHLYEMKRLDAEKWVMSEFERQTKE